MPTLEDLADRVERLLLRYEETKRTKVLLEQQLATVVAERDHLRTRLSAARNRIDDLIDRLPLDTPPESLGEAGAAPAPNNEGAP